MQQEAPFDFNDLARKRRQRFVVGKDAALHGSDSSDNRIYGAFSDSRELDELNKELHLSPQGSQTGKYSFDIRKDILLHGSSTAANKLNGYFSSGENLDELDKLRLKTLAEGRIKQNRADWSDDAAQRPIGPFQIVHRLEREEDEHCFGEGNTMIEINTPKASPSQRGNLTERLYDFRGEKRAGAAVVRQAIGLSDPNAPVPVEARGLTDYGQEPIAVRRQCSVEKRRQIDYQVMVADPDYKWASDPASMRSPRHVANTIDMLHMPLGYEGSVPQGVLEQRMQHRNANGVLEKTDVGPYSSDHLMCQLDGFVKRSKQPELDLSLNIPRLKLGTPISQPKAESPIHPVSSRGYVEYPSTYGVSGSQTERRLEAGIQNGSYPSPRALCHYPYGRYNTHVMN